MGLFGFLKSKNNSKELLLNLLSHNADMIQKSEGKSCNDAEYLAICLIIDDLQKRPNGRAGYRTMMNIYKPTISST